MESQELKILLREIPSVMHSGTKQALCADDIEQPVDDSLSGALGGKSMITLILEVINDGNAIPDHFTIRQLQSWHALPVTGSWCDVPYIVF